MFHAAIARPQKVVALIGIATAVDGLVIKFNELPVEVSHRQPHCIPLIILLLPFLLNICSCVIFSLTYYIGPSFVLATSLNTISLFSLLFGLLFKVSFSSVPSTHSGKYLSHINEITL